MGAQIDHSVMHKTGPFTYRIHGQNAHRIGSLVPEPGRPPKFSQLYIFDTANEIQNRITTVKRTAKVGELDPKIVKELIETMDTYNCLTKIFRKARDIHETDSCQDFSIRLVGQSKRNRQYDMPQTDEIAGLIIGDFTEDMAERDLVVQHRSSGLQHISDMHPLFMTLQYPILFPYGQSGFNENIPVTNTDGNQRKREYITKREFFSYQLQTRLDEGMKKIRADLYNNVQDAVMNGDTDARSLGKRVILPSNLFITITTNPKWDEITDHLKMYGSDDPNDRPDLEARVFKMKLDELISDFNKGTFFPRPKAAVYTIEFQKRGLPHAHIILWLEEPKKLWDHSWQDMAEDVLMHQRRLLRFQALQLTPSELQHYTLIEIESLLQNFEKSLNEFTGMPLPNKAIMDEMKKKAMARHNQFDIAEETMIHQSLFDKLNHH
uniref:Helitron helicase-like domain-containing protein n=1 Tax=Brassica oleracea var. oleracea TaxID=109376 RepID=A0A0D3BH09_BRAOL